MNEATIIFLVASGLFNLFFIIVVFRQRTIIKNDLNCKELQKTLFKVLPDLVWLKDTEGKYLMCNKRFELFFGAKEEEVSGKTDYDFVDKDLADLFRENDNKALFENKVVQNEEEVTFAYDGHNEILETRKTAVYDNEGNVIGVLGIARDISDRKKKESELKESELKLTSVINNSRSAILLIDREYKVHLVNNVAKGTYECLYGKEIECGMSIKHYFGKNEYQWEENIRKCFKGETIKTTHEHKHRDGSYHFEVQVSPISDNDEIKWVSIFMRDVTKYYKTKEKVSENERMLKLVINSIPQSIFWKDKNSVYMGCNKNFAKNAGVKTPEDIFGKTDYDLPWKKDEADFFVKVDKEVMTSNTPMYNVVEKQKQANGKDAWLETNKLPIADKSGEVIGILGTFEDITQRITQEEAIRKSQRILTEILNTIPISVFWKDTNGVYMGANKVFADDAGKNSIEEIIGKDDFEMHWSKNAEYHRADDRNVITSEKPRLDYEEEFITENGNMKWINKSKVPLRDSNGNVYGILGAYEDITERKKHELELERKNTELNLISESLKTINIELQEALDEAHKSKELEKANQKLSKTLDALKTKQQQLKKLNQELIETHAEEQQLNEELIATNEQLYDQKKELEDVLNELKQTQVHLVNSEKLASIGILASSITHEINNPINFIQGGKTAIELHIEEKCPEFKEEFTPLIQMIDEGIERVTKIIRSMSRFNHSSDSNDENCDLHTILDDCLVMLNNQLKYKAVINKDYTPASFNVKGNEGKLHQAFLNILSNTEHAIDKDGKIDITTFIEKDTITVKIEDNGHGIAKDILDKITKPFFTTKPSGKGTGLGLSITSDIIKEHQGDIMYESEVGVGTTVTVTLPVIPS